MRKKVFVSAMIEVEWDEKQSFTDNLKVTRKSVSERLGTNQVCLMVS